jgi:hypothetical protein
MDGVLRLTLSISTDFLMYRDAGCPLAGIASALAKALFFGTFTGSCSRDNWIGHCPKRCRMADYIQNGVSLTTPSG